MMRALVWMVEEACLALQPCLSASDLGDVSQAGSLKPELLSRSRLYQPD
jgi:hypothetical protein